MADTITIKGMKQRADKFLAVSTFEELALLLKKNSLRLAAMAANPSYQEFQIPKKNGGKRLIENPEKELKKIQRLLNDFLQAVYFSHRTKSAYGFLSVPVDDPSPRHILSNAEAHVGCTWMLNVDMKDFFHQISFERTKQLFEAPIFGFNEAVSLPLAALCCYKGRLPMGAPTSPIISNLTTIPLDQDLEHWAEQNGLCYTRYADDLSFSGHTEITQLHFKEIQSWINAYDLVLNPNKVKFYPPGGPPKEVTGLVVGLDRVYLSDEYRQGLKGAIEHLSIVVDAQYLTPSGSSQQSVWVNELQQKVKGKVEFARHIMGEHDDEFMAYEHAFEQAIEPPEFFGPLSWLDFGYAPINFLK